MRLLLLLSAIFSAPAMVPDFGFEQNRGQAPRDVTWLTRVHGAQVYFKNTGIVFVPFAGEAATLSFGGVSKPEWKPAGASGGPTGASELHRQRNSLHSSRDRARRCRPASPAARLS